MTKTHLVVAFAAAIMALSGCFGNSSSAFDFEPGTNYKPTGRTVDLKATVVDMDQTLYPGLTAWLWAFCIEPTDPNDAYSAAAIEEFTPLPGDKVVTGLGAEMPELRGKCSVPGPTIRVQQGDNVIVRFSHTHFHPHTIHWHGQFVPWEADGAPGVTQDGVSSGGSFIYEFEAKRAGTLWYHCHVDTQQHLMQGLYGMIIVEPQDDTYEPKDIDREYVMILSTMNRAAVEGLAGGNRHNHPSGCASGFVGCENPPSQAGSPDVFLINGHSYPLTMEQNQTLIKLGEGERIRIRILNAGETTEEIHPHGHDMLVTHQDGNPLPLSSRYWVDTLRVGPAERFDVVIEGNNPGPWMIHTHVSSHETNCAKSPGGMHTMLVYPEYEHKMHEFNAELPATCARDSVLVLPSDVVDSKRFDFGTDTDGVAGSWGFPIDLSCAVRKLDFRAHLEFSGHSGIASALTNVTVDLKEPSGDVVSRFTLGAREDPQGTPVLDASFILQGIGLRSLKQGNYTVEVSGEQTFEASLELEVVIDYYEDFEQSRTAHLVYDVTACPGYN